MNPPTFARMLLQDRLVVAATLGVLLVLGMMAWFLFGDSAVDQPKRFTHMHCSACGEEVAYNPKTVDEPCAFCSSGAYLPTSGSFQGKNEMLSLTGKIFVYVLVTAVLLQGLAYLGVSRLRKLRLSAEVHRKRMLVCLCPFCQRKIGYPATRAGTGVLCSRCKTAFALPTVESVSNP